MTTLAPNLDPELAISCGEGWVFNPYQDLFWCRLDGRLLAPDHPDIPMEALAIRAKQEWMVPKSGSPHRIADRMRKLETLAVHDRWRWDNEEREWEEFMRGSQWTPEQVAQMTRRV